MTDEELKAHLLDDCRWYFNPQGPEAVARIEELENELNLAVHDANYLLDKAKKQRNRIKELEAKIEEQAKEIRATALETLQKQRHRLYTRIDEKQKRIEELEAGIAKSREVAEFCRDRQFSGEISGAMDSIVDLADALTHQ